jgi:transcriptional regulator with XRE-family HTH domain
MEDEGGKYALCVSFAINHFFAKDGRSQQRVSKGQKFSNSTLSLALSGKREIKVSTLLEISKALRVTPLDIILYAQRVFDDVDEFNRVKAFFEKTEALRTELKEMKKGIAGV